MKISKGFLKYTINERGVALLIALMMLIMLTILGFAAIMTSTTDINIAGNLKNGTSSLFAAEGGIDEVKMRLGSKAQDNNGNSLTFTNLDTWVNPQGYSPTWGKYLMNNNLSQGAAAQLLQNSSSPYYDKDYSASMQIVPSVQASVNWQWVKVQHLTNNSKQVQCFTQNGPVTCQGANQFPIEQVTALVNQNGTAKKITVLLQPVVNPLWQNAAFGVNSVALDNNAQTGSYTSVTGVTNPAVGCGASGGSIQTNGSGNGVISISNNATVCGNATVGVGGNTGASISVGNNGAVNGAKKVAATNVAVNLPSAPVGCTDVTASIAALKNSQNLTIPSNGTNCFLISTVDINNKNTITFPAGSTVYVTGKLELENNSTITAATNLPADLLIYGTSTATEFELENNATAYAAIYAPTASVELENNATVFGAVTGQTVSLSNNAFINYDKNLQNVGNSVASYTNYAWNQVQ